MAFAEPALSSEVRPRWPVRLLLLLSLATLAVVGRAQPGAALFERAVVIEPRLPQSSVYEVLEDRRGFLWFATREGLGRWDGYTMRTWRRQAFDAGSLPGNVVRQLIEDATGDLWAVTEATDRRPTGVARLVGPAHDGVRVIGSRSLDVRLHIANPHSEEPHCDLSSVWGKNAHSCRMATVSCE